MKKIIITLAACLAIGSLSAQKFGIQAGMNFSKMHTGKSALDDAVDSKTGFSAGVTYDLHLPIGFGINTGLMYVERQSEANNTTFKTSSLEIPVNATWTVLNIAGIRPFIMAGPYFDFTLVAKKGGEKLDIGDDMKRANMGLAMGVGVDLFRHVRVLYQYDLGLTDVDSNGDNSAKYRGNRISAAFLF